MGPAAVVLTRVLMDECTLAPWRTFLRSVSSEVCGCDFWVASTKQIGCRVGKEPRSFSFQIGLDEYDEVDLNNLTDALGWTPKGALSLAAGCKSKLDHELERNA